MCTKIKHPKVVKPSGTWHLPGLAVARGEGAGAGRGGGTGKSVPIALNSLSGNGNY